MTLEDRVKHLPHFQSYCLCFTGDGHEKRVHEAIEVAGKTEAKSETSVTMVHWEGGGEEGQESNCTHK